MLRRIASSLSRPASSRSAALLPHGLHLGDNLLGQLGRAERVRVAPLDLVADEIHAGHTGVGVVGRRRGERGIRDDRGGARRRAWRPGSGVATPGPAAPGPGPRPTDGPTRSPPPDRPQRAPPSRTAPVEHARVGAGRPGAPQTPRPRSRRPGSAPALRVPLRRRRVRLSRFRHLRSHRLAALAGRSLSRHATTAAVPGEPALAARSGPRHPGDQGRCGRMEAGDRPVTRRRSEDFWRDSAFAAATDLMTFGARRRFRQT